MFWELAGVPAVAARRGTRVESVHNVAACVVDADGALVEIAPPLVSPETLYGTPDSN